MNYPEKAKLEATHTDENGYLYRVVGNIPSQFCVDYWDLRFCRWVQDLGINFDYLMKIIK